MPDGPAPRLDEADGVGARGEWRERDSRSSLGAAAGRRANETRRLTRLVDAHHRPCPDVARLVEGHTHLRLTVGRERYIAPDVGVDPARSSDQTDDLHLRCR